ncbi:hypothetical protein [Rummeliibacillus pycnus]|uniref:hypothetical protein n=1 Tax=Rummeliibacillus pycnus TaxID=101070 RepID=UPI0037CB7309
MATSGTAIKANITVGALNTNLGGGNINALPSSQKTVLQSFVQDYKGDKSLILSQCKDGSTSPEMGGSQGDISLTKFKTTNALGTVTHLMHDESAMTGTYLGTNSETEKSCYYKTGASGWGHGTQVAIEYAPDGVYMWADYDSPCENRAKNKSAGFDDGHPVGKIVARFPMYGTKSFEGKSNVYGDSQIKTFTLNKRIAGLLDSDSATVSIDNVNGLLAVKYLDENRKMKITVFKITYTDAYKTSLKMADITFTELGTINAPKVKWAKATSTGKADPDNIANLTPNGWGIFGDYIYLMFGTAYWTKDTAQGGQKEWFSPDSALMTANGGSMSDGQGGTTTKLGNTQLMCLNWKTGTQELSFTEAGKSMVHREPEGMFVRPTVSGSNVTGLTVLMGFACDIPGHRKFSIYEKVTTF